MRKSFFPEFCAEHRDNTARKRCGFPRSFYPLGRSRREISGRPADRPAVIRVRRRRRRRVGRGATGRYGCFGGEK